MQHGIQSVGPLKALYTSTPGRPVHSKAVSTSLGRKELLKNRASWNVWLCGQDLHLRVSTRSSGAVDRSITLIYR